MIAFIVVAGGPERGGEARRGTCLAAPSAAASAIINSISHREGLGPIFAHAVVPVRRAVRASTMAVHTMGRILNRDRKPARNSFFGRARFQLRQKSPRCASDGFHVNRSFHDAPACQVQSDRSVLKCPTKALKGLTR